MNIAVAPRRSESSERSIVRSRTNWALALCVFAATIIAYPVTWDPGTRLDHYHIESIAVARSVASRGTFADPFFVLPTGPSAHMAPAYPLIVAGIINVFGIGANGLFALQWLMKIVVALELGLLPFLADCFGLGGISGALAAAAWLIAKPPLQLWENDFAGLVIVLLAFPMCRAFRRRLSTAELIYSGALWGVLLLFTPVPAPVLAVFLLALWLVSPQPKRTAVVIAVVAFAVISPWLVRNYLVFHRPVFMRDNLGLELAVSNNACAHFSINLNLVTGCFAQNHPNDSVTQAERVGGMGEVAYNKARQHEATEWIMAHRARFALLTAERFAAFWLPNARYNPRGNDEPRRTAWVVDLMTVLSLPGLVLIFRRDRYVGLVLALWLVFFPAVYYLIQFDPRYRQPIFWATLLPAAYSLVRIAERLKESAIRRRLVLGR